MAKRTLVVLICGLSIGACGSSSKPSGSGASRTYAQAINYSNCMRGHGVPSFPDPLAGGGYPAFSSQTNQRDPAFQSALVACARLQPGGNGPKPRVTEAQLAGMVLNARCIRRHGVPHFPDPSITPTPSASGDPFVPGDVNVRGPAVEQAARTCAHVGTPIPGVGVG